MTPATFPWPGPLHFNQRRIYCIGMTDEPTTPPPAATPPVPEIASVAPIPPARSSRWPLAISILALAVAACAAALTLWQFKLLRENQSLQQRPIVHVSGPLVATVPEPQDPTSNSLAITAVLTNSGNSATKDLKFFIRCVTAREPIAEPWPLLFQDKIEKLSQVIGPHASAPARCAFNPQQVREIAAGKLHGYVLGDITYRGRSDDILYRTQFSWQLADVRVEPAGGQVTLLAVPHGQHNCADEDCPLAIMIR